MFFFNGRAHFFAFSLIIEGTTEKVLQFIMPQKSISDQNLGFIVQIMYFWTLRRASNNEQLLIFIIFVLKYFSDDLFIAAPYRLMLILHKDVLFHYLLNLYSQNSWGKFQSSIWDFAKAIFRLALLARWFSIRILQFG